MALISKGAQLMIDKTTNSSLVSVANTFIGTNTEIDDLMGINLVFPGLQEISAVTIAGAGGTYDQIEVTTLADAKHVYVNGLLAEENSSNEISCKFLYNPVLFKAFISTANREEYVASGKQAPTEGGAEYLAYSHYVIDIPNGGHFKFDASIGSITMDTVSTNNALTFSVIFKVSKITMSDTNFVAK